MSVLMSLGSQPLNPRTGCQRNSGLAEAAGVVGSGIVPAARVIDAILNRMNYEKQSISVR
jgi:hypothetical protein